jgi:hypothetical protein
MPPRKAVKDAGVTKKKRPSKVSPKANRKSGDSFYHSGNNGSAPPQGQQALTKLFDKYRGRSTSLGDLRY